MSIQVKVLTEPYKYKIGTVNMSPEKFQDLPVWRDVIVWFGNKGIHKERRELKLVESDSK